MIDPFAISLFVALGATASGIKVSSGGRELLSGIDSGTTLSLGGLAFSEQKLYRNSRTHSRTRCTKIPFLRLW
jgi:hypothetical protein